MRQITALDVTVLLVGAWWLTRVARTQRRRTKTTPLKGPASKSFIFGNSHFLSVQEDPALAYEEWAEQYGAVYRTPMALGGTHVVLCDPQGIQHLFSKEPYGYIHSPSDKILIETMVGKGVLWADGDSHKRQRKTLAPAFSNAAIRKLSPIFFDSAYQVKEAWDNLLQSGQSDEAVIDVQDWMNRVSLDSVGMAGFSHDFGTLRGKRSAIAEVFDSFSKLKFTIFDILIFILMESFPILARAPSPRNILELKFNSTAEQISKELLERTRKEEGTVHGKGDHSVMGRLVQASMDTSGPHMPEDEVVAQMKVLIVAGYETTATSLTWALIELSKNVSFQTKLREELTTHFRQGSDPTYDQLNNDLPYLDAVVHEILRLHAPVWDVIRVPVEDDVIPLGAPLQTADNKTVDRISIAAGEYVFIPIRAINRSTNVWGPDAKEFRPQRWLEEDGIPEKAKEISAYRHLFTFMDGPRTCLGKGFAVAEFKATLSVLVRNYSFNLRDGPDTKFEIGRMILPRPKMVGEDGYQVQLRVRRVD